MQALRRGAFSWTLVIAVVLMFVSGVDGAFGQDETIAALGYIDMEEIVETFPEVSRGVSVYIELQRRQDREIRDGMRRIDEVALDMLDARVEGRDSIADRREREVANRREDLRALRQLWNRRLDAALDDLQGDPFYVRLQRSIEYVAIQKGFDLIQVIGPQVYYVASEVDVTEDVIDRMRETAR